ncbi:PKD domain-containing protein [Micromonospora sp. URMC 103]|uniref:PKD domain-containing protein n=1 Tax=Micromonospora sp. URMC 103 TaxID=3423406 RepID=UPI003F19AC10
MTALALVMSASAVPAHAAASEPTTASTGAGEFRIKKLGAASSPSARASNADDEAQQEQQRKRRLQLAREEGQQGTGARLAATDYCNEELYAEQTGGIVLNHYKYCESTRYSIEHVVCAYKVFGVCLWENQVGYAEFRMLTRGEGWDGGMPPTRQNDWVDPALNQINWVTRLDQWDKVKGDIGAFPLTVEMLCSTNYSPGPCVEDPQGHTDTRPVAAWMAFGETQQRWLQDPSRGYGDDGIAVFDFRSRIKFMDEEGETAGNSYRCDSASYLIGKRGCMFHKTELYFRSLDLAEGSDVYEEAWHVYEAFRQPGVTKPAFGAKDVPGNPDAAQPKALTRLYPAYDRAIYDNNHSTAVATCEADFPQPYQVGPNGEARECDEYPFRATYQGASVADPALNFSAKPINALHNGTGGGHLGYWYTNSQRVLHQDKFFVVLVNTDFSGGGGGGGGGSVPNQAPSVSAGPDVTGDEGSAILLTGSASDLETTPAQSWSYTAGPDVDAGATCSFSNSQSAATKITCTDDGTYTVTLTANDGVNAAVSDSATVHVRNVAPRMTGTGVEPWSAYRVGTAVPLNGLFTDPGSNDTHTCRITWDDGGQTEEFAAQNGSCARSHVYAHAGMYTIKTTVTDDDGGVGQAQTMIVVYDPEGGFATQGGYLDSPAGALTADPQQSSRLHVQFNVKYQPGETGPIPGGGKVAAQLAGTNFSLDSTALEWLVVTPTGRVAVKGSGTVNGEEGYGFVAYGDDAQDSVRLVVWPLSSGRIPGFETVYDNRSEGDYDLDLFDPQPLAGGNLTVHS